MKDRLITWEIHEMGAGNGRDTRPACRGSEARLVRFKLSCQMKMGVVLLPHLALGLLFALLLYLSDELPTAESE